MPIPPGTRFGPYEIVSPLGSGGMGEVYRARDTKLHREVAIKVLPDAVAHDPERLARLEREARALAALNHPHIAQIYGFEDSTGIPALAMEFVDGATLADRIARGPLPVREALEIARQIAEALEAAHEQGIVHRDLKPANAMIRHDGTVKVLDFGLAKALGSGPVRQDAAGGADDFASSPTRTSAQTQIGMIVGTAAYMAPEQAQGRSTDKRVDIWAFGCLLYEMLTGRRAFGGATISDTLAAVLRDEVDWSALPADVPPSARRVLKRSLERDPRRRLHDIADARIELADSLEPDASPAPAVVPARLRVVRSLALVAAGAAIVAVPLWLALRPQPPDERVQRFALAGLTSLVIDPNQSLTLSPDGRVLAYRGRSPDGTDQLFIRQSDALLPAAVPGTEGARLPFFSADGEWLAFFSDGSLKKVALAGGAPQTIAAAQTPLGGTWMDDGSIAFVADADSGLVRVPAAGGAPETLIPIERRAGESILATPWALPGSRAILLQVRRGTRFDLAVFSLRDRTLQVLAEDAFSPVWVPTGHILFHQGNAVMALPFDRERLAATGAAFPVLSGLATRISFQTRLFAVARDGTLAYVPAARAGEGGWHVLSVDRQGQSSVITALDRPADTPRLSPDGSRVAFRTPAPNCDIWVHDLARGATTRLTHEGDNHGVVWTPDGARVATARERPDSVEIITVPADGSGSSERLASFPPGSGALPSSWAADTLVVQSGGGQTGSDISALPGRGGDPTPLVHSSFDDAAGVISSDGRFVAYVSNQSGGRSEVYLQPLGEKGSRVQVSTAGGVEPVWSKNGTELFFRRGRDLLAVRIQTASRLVVERPQVLFSGDFAFGALASIASAIPNYDVTPDGQRFVMMTGNQWQEGQVVVVLNWFADWKPLGTGAAQ